jgi:diguanylate cyclase (GGDEF)-like protein
VAVGYNELALKSTEKIISNVYAQKIESKLNYFLDTKKDISQYIYNDVMNNPATKQCMIDANSGDENLKNAARKKLWDTFKFSYSQMKLFEIQQLHFHLPNNESFLRFHSPEKFGDSLTGIRSTVEYVNTTLRPISGFEEGRMFNGFRYVYPIVFDGIHYGSVEVSVKSTILEKYFSGFTNATFDIIFDESVVTEKVFKELQALNYIHSNFDGYLKLNLDKEPDFRNNPIKGKIVGYLTNHKINGMTLKKGKDLHTLVYIKDGVFVVNFMPIKNPISNTTVGYIITYEESTALDNIIHTTRMYQSVGLVLIVLLLVMLWKNKNKDLDSKKEFQKLAEVDTLTGIANRQSFNTEIKKLFDDRRVKNLTISILDIDDFKTINDKFGHDVGDIALKDVTKILKHHIRAEDFLARWGGEEFVIVLKDPDGHTEEILENIRHHIARDKSEEYGSLTASFGATPMKKHKTIDDAFKAADENLYQAKQNGKNQIVFK